MHPAFVAWWLANKKNRALPAIKDSKEQDQRFKEWLRDAAKASREFNEAIKQIRNPIGTRIVSAIVRGLDIESRTVLPSAPGGMEAPFYPQNPESTDLFKILAFVRFGITFRELILRIDNPNPDHEAHGMLVAVHHDYLRVMCGVDLGSLKLKFSWDHFQIITQGLDFGLDKLTPDELAECLDQICPCGRKKHSAEYLKKVRSLIRKAGKRLSKE